MAVSTALTAASATGLEQRSLGGDAGDEVGFLHFCAPWNFDRPRRFWSMMDLVGEWCRAAAKSVSRYLALPFHEADRLRATGTGGWSATC